MKWLAWFRRDHGADFKSPIADELEKARKAARESEREKAQMEQLFAEAVERSKAVVSSQRRTVATLYLRISEREHENAGH